MAALRGRLWEFGRMLWARGVQVLREGGKGFMGGGGQERELGGNLGGGGPKGWEDSRGREGFMGVLRGEMEILRGFGGG